MILPYRDLRTAEEDILPGPHFRVLFLDLYLDDIARMLNNFCDHGLVPSSHFSQNALNQIHETAIHPELPENADAAAEGCAIGFDHAECPVDAPEGKEDDEEVMDGPEALVVGTAGLLDGGEEHRH